MPRAALLSLLLCLLPAAALPAAPLPSVFLEELTWTEVRDAVKGGKTTIIVPVGGTEQSGPHIALGKHNARVHFMAGRIAAALGDSLVAPVLAYVPEGSTNPATEHMRFPGTISIPESTFEEILVATGRSMRRHGFREVVFIGDHGGYQKAMKRAAVQLNREWAGGPVRANAVDEYYTAISTEYSKALAARGFAEDEIGTHAGLADTSLTLAIDPSLVRTDRLRGSNSKEEGVSGDPERSSTDLGKIGVDLVVKRTAEAIRAARSANP
ncbi:MAG TPA: creatininase family protein [Usitatibacter sp.]|nr:creatininase family protein [Usitatibacter sp.]